MIRSRCVIVYSACTTRNVIQGCSFTIVIVLVKPNKLHVIALIASSVTQPQTQQIIWVPNNWMSIQ